MSGYLRGLHDRGRVVYGAVGRRLGARPRLDVIARQLGASERLVYRILVEKANPG